MSKSMIFANVVCFIIGLVGAAAIEDFWKDRKKGPLAAVIWLVLWTTPPLIRLYIEAVFG